MNYFYKLPYVNVNINNDSFYINFTKEQNELHPIINNSLYKYLKQTKELITGNEKQWDKYKKYTNPYEFIHTNCENSMYCISKIKPLSRAFFKMIEITNSFNLLKDNTLTNNFTSFHLAEGPGGFIEALLRMRMNKNDKYYGMTLIDNKDENVPGWKKAIRFLKNNKNVIIEKGKDKTGNLYSIENFEYIYKKYGNKMEIVTADGGFDFSIDYSKQEIIALRLILTQVLYAIMLQRKSGSFILKIFDIFTKPMIDIIYLISCFYDEVYIYKPQTSRYGNSEKYIVCKNFKYDNTDSLYKSFHNIINTLFIVDYDNFIIKNILSINIPELYKNTLSEINAIYGQQQIENINNTFILIQNYTKTREKMNVYKHNNIQKCIQWCINNDIPYNNIIKNNIFKKTRKENSFSSNDASDNSDDSIWS